MTAFPARSEVDYLPRRRERREAFGQLLSTLTRSLDSQGDVSLMRGAFEQAIRRLVPVRSVQLRECASRWIAAADDGSGGESIALDVPGPDEASRGILEARMEPGSPLAARGESH